jgi:hypothetical protein
VPHKTGSFLSNYTQNPRMFHVPVYINIPMSFLSHLDDC